MRTLKLTPKTVDFAFAWNLQVEAKAELRDVETRVNAVNSLVSIIVMILEQGSLFHINPPGGSFTNSENSPGLSKQTIDAVCKITMHKDATLGVPKAEKAEQSHYEADTSSTSDSRLDGSSSNTDYGQRVHDAAKPAQSDQLHEDRVKISNDAQSTEAGSVTQKQQEILGNFCKDANVPRVVEALMNCMKDYTITNRCVFMIRL